MNMRLSVVVILVLYILPTIAAAQEERHPLLLINNMSVAIQASVLLGVLTIATMLTIKRMGSKTKKLVFVLFVLLIGGATAIMNASLIYSNVTSVTGGPVHWHAHVAFEFCGTPYELPPENIAVDLPIHTHADQLIHIETTPHTWKDVELHLFFENIGGEFTPSSLAIPTSQGLVRVQNGDLCNGAPGSLKMYVNDKLEPTMDKYVITPLEAGDIDQIRFVFDNE